MSIVTFRAVHSRALWLVLAALALAAILVVASPAQPAAAAPCGPATTVSTEAQLNAAITAYNLVNTSCEFTIQLTGNIALTASATAINNTTAGVSLVIEGGGFTVNGQNLAGVRPFDIAANTTVTMNDITITGGNANGSGGGIRNLGTLTLADSTITGNTAQSPNSGGGIFNGSGGTLTVTRSTISNNSTFNRGGGIENESSLTVTDSTITGNSAQTGGGVSNNVNTPVVITGSTIASNSASLVGGGVFNTGNSMTIRNSTISGNGAGGSGGGVYNEFRLALDSVTITGNTSSALYNADYTAAHVTIQNSILANSTGPYDCVNGSLSTVTIVNPNLVETQNNCGSFTLTSDPQLGPLQNNGGPTQTHALLTGSPAINAGATALTTDQRNYVRPAGAADDIGAYEYDAILAVTLASFDAQAQAGHVLVTWQTVSETGNAGFNLYRTQSAQAPTPSDLLASVPSQAPGSTQGFAYAYQDQAVTAGATYWYWLEDVDMSGATTLHGPVSVVFTAPTAVTLSGLEAAADRPALAWPWLLALLAAVLAAGLVAWRRHNAAA